MLRLSIFFLVICIGFTLTKNTQNQKSNVNKNYQLQQYEKIIPNKSQDKVVQTFFKGLDLLNVGSPSSLNPLEVSEMRREDLGHKKKTKKNTEYSKDTKIVKEIFGLQIPNNFECDIHPYLFQECREKDWKSKNDKTKYLCDLFGLNRGRCEHIDVNENFIDQTTLFQEVNQISMTYKYPISPTKGKNWQIDFRGYQKRLCSKWSCSKWIKHRPDKFNCTIILENAFCYNEALDIKRDCSKKNNKWVCYNWFFYQEKKLGLAFHANLGSPAQAWPIFV